MAKKLHKRSFLAGVQEWLGGGKEYANSLSDAKLQTPVLIRSNTFSSWGMIGNKSLNETNIMSIPAVKSAVELITNTVGTLPIGLYKMDGDNTPQEIEGDRRIRLLNADTNDVLTGTNFKQKITKDLLLYGESVTVVERNDNKPTEIDGLYPIDTDKLQVDVYTANGYSFYPQYIYNAIMGRYYLDNTDVINITMNSDDGLVGQGVIAKGSDTLKMALAQYQFEYNLLNQGAMPSGILSFEKLMNKDTLNEARKNFNQAFSGYANTGKVVALEGGATYTPLQIDPDKLQLDDSKTNMIGQIARLFNLPETMLNSKANKYNSNEENDIQYFQFCLKPILEAIQSALNKYFLLEKEKDNGYFFEFNTDSIFLNTLDEKTQAYTKLFDDGVMTYNEIRNKLGLAPTSDGNDYSKFSLGDVLLNQTTGQATVFNTMQADKHSGANTQNPGSNPADEISNQSTPKTDTSSQPSTTNSQQGAKTKK